MSLRINHNISAINSHRNLIQNTKTQAKNLERLSSGLKINRGADAPAGLIISERLRAQVAGKGGATQGKFSERVVKMVVDLALLGGAGSVRAEIRTVPRCRSGARSSGV